MILCPQTICKTNDCLISKCDSWDCADWINLCITIVFFLLGLAIIFWLKPRLIIPKSRIIVDRGSRNGNLKVTIKNKGFFDVNNIKVECCLLLSDGSTLHLKPDYEEFLIVRSKWKMFLFIPYWYNSTIDNARVFQFNEYHPSALVYTRHIPLSTRLSDGNHKIRFRIHAQHSFSGFGKSFEQIF